MQQHHDTQGNTRTGSARKRAIWRALRHYFLLGWTRYHGNLIRHDSRLAAFFPKEDIAAVRTLFASKRRWWYQQDPLLPFRRNDHQVHLPATIAKEETAHTVRGGVLQLVTYNCRTLGHSSARLVEIAEDLHSRGVQAAALQGACWKHATPRSEWTVYSREGRPIYFCFSWSKAGSDTHGGVLLLLQVERFDKQKFTERYDPVKCCAGRIGGVRYVDRRAEGPQDHTFITAYAPQETASDEDKQAFFTELQTLVQTLPRRTAVWMMGDFNAHVGPDSQHRSVGRQDAEPTNDNGLLLGHMCDSLGLCLVNTFHAAGSTWWSADQLTEHRIDYIAMRRAFQRKVKRCRVSKLLGRRWQTTPIADHWPLELAVGLQAAWAKPRPKHAVLQWNRHAILRAATDPTLYMPFLQDVSEALLQHSLTDSGQSAQEGWSGISASLHGVAVKHFCMQPDQRNPKILPQTFVQLQRRREVMYMYLEEKQQLAAACSQQRRFWLLRVSFRAWQLQRLMAQTQKAVRDDVKAWERVLEDKLQSAVDKNNSREAWSLCRQLAGRHFKKLGARAPPSAKPIPKTSWVQHFRAVQNATECIEATARTPDQPQLFSPLFRGEEGCRKLADAARKMPRDRATPSGALPIELWSIILQPPDRAMLPPGHLLMPQLERLQEMGQNPAEWCVGHGCAVPKPGGEPTPAGMRVINLLDPMGKAFFKATLDAHADQRAEHQYGYARRCSRRDAILQITTLLERLYKGRLCTAANLYDLTKAFDMISSHSVVRDLRNNQPFHECSLAMLEDMQGRLRIRMPLATGGSFCVLLKDGVLQGGGTGPRLFRRVYDKVVGDWRDVPPLDSYTCVRYSGRTLDISTASYADDLIRVEAAQTAAEVEATTLDKTQQLKQSLQPHRLQLNMKKCESLVSVRGKGAYVSARRLYGGAWMGPPLKDSVKYLGAHLQAQPSCKLEVSKRIAAARSAFANVRQVLPEIYSAPPTQDHGLSSRRERGAPFSTRSESIEPERP